MQITDGLQAQQDFTKSNLRLVVSIAKRYQTSGVPLLDIIQNGNIGLMRAVELFDPNLGFKFSTYATNWIRQSITRGIANTGRTIRIPVHMSDLLNAYNKLENESFQLPKPYTDKQYCSKLSISQVQLKQMRLDLERSKTVSLDSPLSTDEDGDLTNADRIADEQTIDMANDITNQLQATKDLGIMVGSLDHREAQVIALRFGLADGVPLTLEEVGNQFNLSREGIRQIESRAMGKLRKESRKLPEPQTDR